MRPRLVDGSTPTYRIQWFHDSLGDPSTVAHMLAFEWEGAWDDSVLGPVPGTMCGALVRRLSHNPMSSASTWDWPLCIDCLLYWAAFR